jgi:TatD DNase family protein
MPRDLFDHHAHLDDPGVHATHLVTQLHALAAQGWLGALVPGYDPERYPAVRALIHAVPQLTRAVGMHPEVLAGLADEPARERAWALSLAELEQPRVIAIGEIGLDQRYKRMFPLDVQLAWFQRGLELARSRDLPVVLHLVGWHGHALDLLKQVRPIRGVVHRWSGSLDLVRPFQDAGLHLSMGLEPRETVEKRQAIARAVHPDRLLIETDWPFLDLTYAQALDAMSQLLDSMAQWRQEPRAELATRLVRNARAVYGTPPD